MTQIIKLPFRSLKHDSIGQATGPDDAALDGVAGHNVGNTFNQDDDAPNTGTFYMQTPDARGVNAIQLKMEESSHFRFNLKLTNGNDVTPAMSPTITAYGVTMEPWGISGHYEVDLEWEYDGATQQYIVTLSDGAVSPNGYSFFFDTASNQTSETQQPNLFTDSQQWTHSGGIPFYSLIFPSEDSYDTTVYYGIFRFNLSQDCTSRTPSVSTYSVKMFDSSATSTFDTNHCAVVRWNDGWREFLLTWEEACNLDPNGYWIIYDCADATTQQYPRRYVKLGTSSPEWFQAPDLIPPGDYSDTVIWLGWEHIYQDVDSDVVSLVKEGTSGCFTMVGGTFIRDVAGTASSPDYPGYTGINGLIYKPGGGGYFHHLKIKCSVSYQIKYSVKETMELGLFETPGGSGCDQKSATVFVETDDATLTYSAKNRDPPASRPIHYKDLPASCADIYHFVSSFFKDAHNPGMHFAASDRFVATINFVKLV